MYTLIPICGFFSACEGHQVDKDIEMIMEWVIGSNKAVAYILNFSFMMKVNVTGGGKT